VLGEVLVEEGELVDGVGGGQHGQRSNDNSSESLHGFLFCETRKKNRHEKPETRSGKENVAGNDGGNVKRVNRF